MTGLKFVLSVGSSFLNTGTIIPDSFRVSGNVFSLNALLMLYFVSSLKQNPEFLNVSTGIYIAVALSDGKFFLQQSLQYPQKQTESWIFCLFWLFVLFKS